jgi:beta-phosphoglucomutase-like phosphatase (HAD superfamily)
MSSVQLVVFDIAGTTVRDNGSVAEAFLSAFRDFGFTMPVEEIKKVMGFRKMDAIVLLLEKFAPDVKDNDFLIDRIHTRFIDKMIEFYRNDETLAPLPQCRTRLLRPQRAGDQNSTEYRFHPLHHRYYPAPAALGRSQPVDRPGDL